MHALAASAAPAAFPRAAADAAPCCLHFEPLRPGARGVDVPCDRSGHVPLDTLGERLRNRYFFARACMGRLFAAPVVVGPAAGRP